MKRLARLVSVNGHFIPRARSVYMSTVKSNNPTTSKHPSTFTFSRTLEKLPGAPLTWLNRPLDVPPECPFDVAKTAWFTVAVFLILVTTDVD
ncbi:hypothetical protein M378DRAFT_1065114 [Amanita muscaria Koide BX008]|uniref:Uncharacterized protein n=1 Tax=Amanita muscaria (strain Koide BX008) TaxID=946122 RepID=A0A0C2WUK0_AMAMK|nr:hypothetical protein M378DRAFT_1065114 [Amanita muscaria Koide BX008]